MLLFGPPDVEKMKAKQNVKGLIKALNPSHDSTIRKTAIQALTRISHQLPTSVPDTPNPAVFFGDRATRL